MFRTNVFKPRNSKLLNDVRTESDVSWLLSGGQRFERLWVERLNGTVCRRGDHDGSHDCVRLRARKASCVSRDFTGLSNNKPVHPRGVYRRLQTTGPVAMPIFRSGPIFSRGFRTLNSFMYLCAFCVSTRLYCSQ